MSCSNSTWLIEAEWCLYAFVNSAIIGSDDGLLPDRYQDIIWTNARILLIELLGTNFNEILIEIHAFLFTKIHLKMFGKCSHFVSLNMLKMGHHDCVFISTVHVELKIKKFLFDMFLDIGMHFRFRENNLSDVITIIKGRIEDIDLPVEQVCDHLVRNCQNS